MEKYGISRLEIRRMELNRAIMTALEVRDKYEEALISLKNGNRLDRDKINQPMFEMTDKELEKHYKFEIREIEQDVMKFNNEIMDINKIINR